jgi:predicted RNA binding protein YcfA (HicA-like mRNA interferase family)
MGGSKKAIAKILDKAKTANTTLSEVESALCASGFVCRSGKGSHRIWVHADSRKQVISSHGSTLPSYIVRQIRDLLK